MTRILQVLGRSAGGIATHVADVVRALDGADGLRVDVAGPLDLPIEMPKPVVELVVPEGALVGHLGAIRRLREITADYDVVHSHGLRAGIDAGLAADPDTRSLATVHNLVRPEIAGWKTIVHRRAEGLVVRANDHVFAVSEEIARRLRAVATRRTRDIEVLYLGLGRVPRPLRTRADVRAELGLAPDTSLVVTVARLAPQKALHVMVAAIEEVPGCFLAVLGEGPVRTALEVEVRRRRVTERVRFLGFRNDAHDFVAAADVFCLSSVWEGVPLAAQEAIRLETPIVATDVGGMRELISNKLSGRLVPPGDPGQLARALRDTLASDTDRKRFVERALEDLETRFSTDRMLARLREAYAD